MSVLLRVLLPFLLAALVLVGCGYKGALSLPDQSPVQTERVEPNR